MKYRNINRKYYDPNTGTGSDLGGSGNDSNNQQQSDSNNNQQQSNNENNNENNDAGYANMWDIPDQNSQQDTGQQQNANSQQQQTQSGPTADEQFQEHVKSLNLTQGVDFSLAAQEPEKFQEQMQTAMANVYQAAMVNANKLFEQRAGDLQNELNQHTATTVANDKMVSQMNTTLPFTADAAYKPVADAVLQQFINSGKTPDDAIKEVGGYFKSMYSAMSANMGGPQGNRLQGGFNGQMPSGANNSQQDSEPDWLAVLSGGSGKPSSKD